MPAAGRSGYRLATGPVMGFIHPHSDNYPDGGGGLEQRAHQTTRRPARQTPAARARQARCDVADHGEKAEAG